MAVLEVHPMTDPRSFAVEGELDLGSADVFLSALERAPDDGDLVLDLAGLTFIDSSGLRAILQILDRRNRGGTVVLLHPTPAVERVFSIALPGVTPGLRVEMNGHVRA